MHPVKDLFLLNPEITYLNHGSFGACPKPVFENYQSWQRTLEKEPVQFMTKTGPEALIKSKAVLSEYIGCDAEDFFFIPNPTTAINQVVRSLNFQPGDEVLTTNLEYGAIDKTFEFYSEKCGFTYRRQQISLPLESKEKFLEEFWKGYNKNTKAVSIGQCTSATALVLPVKEICDRAKELGLITIVDGAHVPGHVALNLRELQADFYTGTLHKWLLGPKGSTFLYVNKDFQDHVEPLIISWGYKALNPIKSKFLEENEAQGTRDYSAFLTGPAIMDFFSENNMAERQLICRQIIREQYPEFCRLFNTKPLCPVSEEFLGQMCSIPIQTEKPFELKEVLYNKYSIEIPVMFQADQRYLRISYQVYNSLDELEYLKKCLHELRDYFK